ncbi:MAG: hypothetical protein CMH44_03370 [Muricauda sp.]|nr:hypothetical protein [Allomuricauda sp.]|tara:strand:+ start:1889 stop:3142 length:1254 start_codon:yes stop_codon:yes gene_type:complete
MDITYQDLENFETNCEVELHKIKSHLSAFNIFNVLGIQYREIRHSNFVGWLLDPTGSHGFKSNVLEELLKHLKSKGLISNSELNDYLTPDLANTKVVRESESNIDLFLINEDLSYAITIENKIHSDYSEHQLGDYYEHVERHFPHIKKRIYLTLTPLESIRHKDEKFTHGKKYTNITYKEIIKFLRKCQGLTKNEDVKVSVNQYISMVEKNLTKTSEEIVIARKIYKKYGNVINFIINNQADFSVYQDTMLDVINSLEDGFIISHESAHKNVIYLLPKNQELLDLFYYPEAESRDGDYIFSYVLQIKKDSLSMKLAFGPIAESNQKKQIQKVKQDLLSKMQGFKCLNNNKIPKLETYTDTCENDYARVCSINLFTEDDLISEDKSFRDIFESKFNEVNNILLQPFTKELFDPIEIKD